MDRIKSRNRHYYDENNKDYQNNRAHDDNRPYDDNRENDEHGPCRGDNNQPPVDHKPILRGIRAALERIESILTNPRVGLGEIKAEVRTIENSVCNPYYGLKAIKAAIAEIDNCCGHSCTDSYKLLALLKDIIELLKNPYFGLTEIKKEVAAIEYAVLSSTFGLQEIKSEVIAIEGAVFNPTFGLEEIKSEVAAIHGAVFDPSFGLEEIKSEVAAIENAVLNGTNGLAEIKSEVAAIEGAVFDPSFGLEEIKQEIATIESAVFDPSFGLEEIKTEIVQILNELGAGNSNRSSGPFYAQNNLLEVKVLNNCPDPVGPVTITAYNLATCPKTTLVATNGELITTTITTITPGCAVDAFFDGDPGAPSNISGNQIEVQVTAPGGLPPCVLIYSRTTNEGRVDIANEFCNACYSRIQP